MKNSNWTYTLTLYPIYKAISKRLFCEKLSKFLKPGLQYKQQYHNETDKFLFLVIIHISSCLSIEIELQTIENFVVIRKSTIVYVIMECSMMHNKTFKTWNDSLSREWKMSIYEVQENNFILHKHTFMHTRTYVRLCVLRMWYLCVCNYHLLNRI